MLIMLYKIFEINYLYNYLIIYLAPAPRSPCLGEFCDFYTHLVKICLPSFTALFLTYGWNSFTGMFSGLPAFQKGVFFFLFILHLIMFNVKTKQIK